ncbi:MAG: hypothetical protein WCI57_01755 [Candidatus Berkelbacteria bacterium]
MNKEKNVNVSLIVGVGVPVLMMLFIAAAIYLPGLFKKPQFDFIYSTAEYSYANPLLEVKDQKLGFKCADDQHYYSSDDSTSKEIAAKCTEEFLPKLHRYSIKNNTVMDISYADAQKLVLDTNADSSDGYKVEQGNYNNGDMFSGMFGGGYNEDYNAWYLKGHNRVVKLNITNDSNSSSDTKFVGWVKE